MSSTMELLPVSSFPRKLLPSIYQTNDVPHCAIQADPRFSYSAFIPDEHYPQSPAQSSKLPVLVAVHGTSRRSHRNLAAWREFALENRCAIFAPLFPCLVSGPTDIDGYHYLGKPPRPDSATWDAMIQSRVPVPKVFAQVDNREVRHDLLLLAMLDEISIRWPALDTSRVFLTGFSGGGQFVSRFMLFHPTRLLAVAIGAPGSVTALDFNKPWPAGMADVESICGIGVDMNALKALPIIAAVGGEDTDGMASKVRRFIKDDAKEELDKTRVQRLANQVEQWRSLSMDVEFEVVPEAKHEMEKVNVAFEKFMTKHIKEYWKRNE